MKMYSKIAALALMMGGFAATANAQEVTNTSSATIVAPISIAADGFLEFGDIAAREGGQVIMSADGIRTVGSGDVEILGTDVGVAAGFNVEGEDGASFTVTLPGDITLTAGDSFTMTVSDFTSSLTDNIGEIAGVTPFTVGATLIVAAEQAVGTYVGEFSVSVDYN